MSDTDGDMYVAFVIRHEVCDFQIVPDVDGRGDREIRIRKNGKTVVRFVFYDETLVAFHNRPRDPLHFMDHGQVMDQTIPLDRARKTRHIQHKDRSYFLKFSFDALVDLRRALGVLGSFCQYLVEIVTGGEGR